MNLKELRERAYWACDEVVDNPQEITPTIMNQLINEALEELAPHLNILTSATPTFTAGVASLPSDFVSPVALYDGTDVDTRIKLTQIFDLKDVIDDDDDPTVFMIRNNTQVHIHGITPTSTMQLWYNKYADSLDEDTDEPDEVPKRFHKGLAEIYPPWKLADKLGNDTLADKYEAKWMRFCAKVGAATADDRRSEPITTEVVW